MENIVFLNHKEVCELTGAHTRVRQIQVLKQNGIPHTIKANGWPCVIAANLLPSARHPREPLTWTPRKINNGA